MRVLTLTNWYPPHHYGGYELSCYDVMTRLEERGHDVAVLCSDQRLATATVRAGAPAEHEAVVERSLRLYHDGEDLMRPGWRGRRAVERHNQERLVAALERFAPEVVSVWHLAALSSGLLTTLRQREIPIVYAVCDEWPAYMMKLDPWAGPFAGGPVRRAIGRCVGRVAGAPLGLTDVGAAGPALWVTADLRERTEPRSRLHFAAHAIVYSGIDRTVYPAPATPEKRGGTWSGRLVATGRFDPRKGFETVIRALALLPADTTLALWGRGGEAEQRRLRGIAEELGVADRVEMGSRERDEMPAAYAAGDLFVFPSEWAEPFGLVPIEAMACGTPVAATGVGGSSEFLVDGTNCVLFRPGDPEDLARVVAELAADPDRRAALVAGGHRTAEAMDVERLVDVMEAWHIWTAVGMPTTRPPTRSI
ncbi:MAG TPA: glycosyltransferase family 4 protein [Iamia sp.]|nr:glycosyltransferase family 4 protein [Iamia sp.]